MELREKVRRTLEDSVYYFWMGVGVALGAVTVVRFLLPKAAKVQP